MGKAFPNIHSHVKAERYGLVFGIGFLSMLLVLVPLMMYDDGYFIYYGDFIAQQLPFYELANDAVREGQLGWNWYTDLGSDFLTSYSFYLTGSPFFWLSTLLPRNCVLYAMPWLLSLKHAVAAVTAYAYIRRFVQNRNAAAIGGLLYAFSGFQMFNIFFNHFQDVTALFPLMLIAMEENVNNHRRGWFAAIVAIMAMNNYFFFTGQVVFLILYFFIRLGCRDFHITWKKFFALAMEAVIGVMISGILLVPSVLAVLQNSRVESMLYGEDMVIYWDKTRILRIIQSFFMIPDPPARPILFSSASGKWSSIGGYLPLFSMAGVIAFMGQKKRHWATRIVWICIVCAFVPILNSLFYMLNSSYYARWYYMPILIMALMTAYALDNREIKWKGGVISCAVMLAAFGIMAFIPTKGEENKTELLNFASYTPYFFVVLAICILCWLGLYYLYLCRERSKPYMQKAVWLTTAACIVCTGCVVYYGKLAGADSKFYMDAGIHGEEHLSISYENDEDDYFRVDVSENFDNYPMFWGLSSMRSFQSTVSPSIMEFYDSIGITRDVATRVEPKFYTLRGLLSVKYYFERIADMDEEKPLHIPGFSLYKAENGFNIYRNEHFVPMGFTYENYVTEKMVAGKTDMTKERMLINCLVLTEEQAQTYADIIAPADKDTMDINEAEYLQVCKEQAAEACEDFEYDSKHFAGHITLAQPKLVFFSVPYDKGWTAQVNGKPVTVEKVSAGFMAIRCEAGENDIVFSYETYGLKYGIFLTIAGIVLLVLYLLLSKPLYRGGAHTISHSYDYSRQGDVRAARAYMNTLKQTMQQTKEQQRKDGTDDTSERTKT